MSNLQVYWERLIDFMPDIIESLGETGIMMGFAMIAAIILGLPLGTLLFLTNEDNPRANKVVYQVLSFIINIIRSFPFLLLVVSMQPLIRATYGRATGDPVAASFPMMVIAIALYARFVEQSLMDVDRGVLETADALGANTWQLVTKFLFVEAKSSLIIGYTTAFVSFISYSTIMGVVGGGIGDFAIRYGYQRYETDIMYTAIIMIIVIVQLCQWLGLKVAKKVDHR